MREDAGEEGDGGGGALVGGGEGVFLLDGEGAVVVGAAKGGDDLFPGELVMAPADEA